MSESETKEIREIKQRPKNRFSMHLKKRFTSMWPAADGDSKENSAGEEGNGRVFDLPPSQQQNKGDSLDATPEFRTVGTEGLDYTKLEVSRLSVTSSGTRTSEALLTPLADRLPFDFSQYQLDPLMAARTGCKPRPRSFVAPMSEMRRSSLGLGEYSPAKRRSLGQNDVPAFSATH